MIDWNSVPGEVITVISDLHSNKRAVKAALDAVKQKRTDRLVILGDILTYGIDVNEVVDMVGDSIQNGALLIRGNHDEIYLHMISGTIGIYDRLRPDLKESIDYNFSRLDTKLFSSWPWKNEIVIDNILFSHANPYGNCWEYIKDIYDFRAAANKLEQMSHLAGVFGHTHRSKFHSIKNPSVSSIEGLCDDTFVLNPGSIGQPRSKPPGATLLRLSSHKNMLWAEIEPVEYDMKEHVEDLNKSSISETTKTILTTFFKE